MCWLVLCQLTQARVIREEEASFEKIPKYDLAVDKPVGIFLISDLDGRAQSTLGRAARELVVLGSIRK